MKRIGLAQAVSVLIVSIVRGDPAAMPLTPVPFNAVRFADEFWSRRLETNRLVTIWHDFQKCEETGRIDNFAKAGRLMPGPFRGTPFDDSDVFKVIEGAAYTLALHPDPKLDRYLDELIAKIAAAQETDGYLYTARTIDPKGRVDFFGPDRWSKLRVSHELYNVGHLYEAAVAHYTVTGKRALLEVALKNADLICRVFGPGPDQRKDPPGHQEIELGLIKLYRLTGQRKYLDQAQFFLEQRGRPDGRQLYGPNQQDHKPVLEQDAAVGHAVRAGYMYAAMTDIAVLTGDTAYRSALDRLWDNVVAKKLYLTGGIGARARGEAFGDDYELPNAAAYNETCAAIANALWNHRMFLLHGQARYLDVLERILYNGFLSGVSLTGDRFFYPNPLEFDGTFRFNRGTVTREPWFGTACCPVNVVRFIPSIAGFFYTTRGDHVFVNLYGASTATVKLDRQTLTLIQETRYPWNGAVTLRVAPSRPGRFTLHLRVPGWAQGRPLPSDLYRYFDASTPPIVFKLNGKPARPKFVNGFAGFSRVWQPGDRIELNFPMPVRRVLSHPAVQANAGRVALERGPIVYCAEGVDHGGSALNLALPDDAALAAEHRPDLLGGVTVIRGTALATKTDSTSQTSPASVPFMAIPYYAWGHRGVSQMTVWLPRIVGRGRATAPSSPH